LSPCGDFCADTALVQKKEEHMSLLDSIAVLHKQADDAGSANEAPARLYDTRRIRPDDWAFLVQAIDTVHPGEFEPIDNAILNSSVSKSGERSTIFAVKSTFPTSQTITMWTSGKVLGDGIDLTEIMAAFEKLKSEAAEAVGA